MSKCFSQKINIIRMNNPFGMFIEAHDKIIHLFMRDLEELLDPTRDQQQMKPIMDDLHDN